MKKLLLVAAIVAAGYFGFIQHRGTSPFAESAVSTASSRDADAVLERAFENRSSNILVQGRGTVAKLLSDDTAGSRHQRFIIRLQSGQTLLVAHNIDIAPRVDSIREGDALEFSGEYEWNPKGGVLHWTHRDPNGRHANGWLKHDGHTYQ